VIDCINTEVRDALPDLLHGRLSALDTATMNAHVESCAECRAELALLREVRATAALAPSMDHARMAASIPAYRGAAISAPGRGFIRTNLRNIGLVAAGALIAFTGWSVSRSTLDDGRAAPSVAIAPSPPASLVTPAAPSTQTVAKSGNEATQEVTQVASLSLLGSTQDLSDADLEQLTSDLDQLDALPSAEPQSVTLSVEDIGTDQ
jgi:anti-sigma factor RsiW